MRGRDLSLDLLLRAYAAGAFPMARGRGAREIGWYRPHRRAVLPLEGFHMSRSLARSLRRGGWEITCNRDFAGVLAGCADRPETWISEDIARVFVQAHAQGLAHSLEVRRAGMLVGGVYGLALGGAFFAESMFSRVSDASKLALHDLVRRLQAGGYGLMDVQYMTPHLARLGAVEISAAAYQARLEAALDLRPAPVFDQSQPMTQTS
jgi:leucyl/phenylalanyl-tRNA--protein transferase